MPKVHANSNRALRREGLIGSPEQKARWYPLLLIVILLFTIQSALPLNKAVEIGADEGFELSKAVMTVSGFHLYSEVWNDQPPLHTFLISQIIKHGPTGPLGPRILTSFFAAVLLVSFYYLIRTLSSERSALIAIALLIASPGFIELSSSCMLEIPSLSIAISAMATYLAIPPSRWKAREIVSGILFGAAFEMKLVTVILLPVAALIIALEKRETGGAAGRGLFGRLRPAPALASLSLLGVAGIVSFVGIDFLIDRGAFLRNFQQTWQSHFAASKSFEYGSAEEHPFVWNILLMNWDLTIPALAGLIIVLQRIKRVPSAIIPVVWLTSMCAIFFTHKPWWQYYYVHLALPLCWCAAVTIETAWNLFWRVASKSLKIALGCGTAAVLTWAGARIYLEAQAIRELPQIHSALFLNEIQLYKARTHFMFADEPIYSFHARIPMPPNLAIIPLKRLWSGDLTNDRIREELSRVKPELILVKNNNRQRPFSELLQNEYRAVYEDSEVRLFVRRDVANSAGSGS